MADQIRNEGSQAERRLTIHGLLMEKVVRQISSPCPYCALR